MTKISIITVAYNAVETLEKTLHSVRAQEGVSVEHIVVDGGSTDGTVPLLQAHTPYLSHWISEPDKGIYDAMNKGIDMASGDVIGFLNADDHYASATVLNSVSAQFSEPTIDACYGDLVYFTPDQPHKIRRYWRSAPFRSGLFAKGWCPPHPTFFARRTLYARYGGFDLNYKMGNDVELMMRFLEKHRIKSVYMPEVLVKMQLGGVSNQSLKNILCQNQEVLKAAKALAIPIAPIPFWTYKCIDRFLQFVRLPHRKTVNET